MNKRRLICLAALVPLWTACSDDSSDKQEPAECGENQKEYMGSCYNINDCVPGCNEQTEKCIKGTCYDKNACIPECDSKYSRCVAGKCVNNRICVPECDAETQKCYNGVCYDKNVCTPECNNKTEKCADGRCIDINDCYPACENGQICIQGSCETPDPTLCSGVSCKDKKTYCDDTGHWKACDPGYGCHLGYCIQGLAPECENRSCNADNTKRCDGGVWVSCGSMETCTEGVCQVPADTTCEPGICSDDGKYRCTEDGAYEACPAGMTCEEGTCTNTDINTEETRLWTLCTSNSGCARGICVFEIATSRTMSKAEYGLRNVDRIPVAALDPRIPEGFGVCSQDCTRDPNICATISNNIQQFTCQVVVTGDSPYPPKNEYGETLELPFHKTLNKAEMETAPFASLCRPNDVGEIAYSKSFCAECIDSSTCSDKESCVMGMCLPKCTNNDMCPLNFTCAQVSEMETAFCLPNAGTCSACLDKDSDGQGYGACPKNGFDCDDIRNDVYYGKKLEGCTTNYTDDNCNGKIDYTEVIGSANHCDACNSECKVGSSANISRECELHNGDVDLDDSTHDALFSTYIYGCDSVCSPGFGDCDGDPTNGCETQLVEISGETVTATSDAVAYSLDEDLDGYGVMSPTATHYCCKNDLNACYAMRLTNTNSHDYWDSATLSETAQYSDKIEDCDDKNALRYPHNPDVCDGIDNDCDDSTADGSASQVKLEDYQYVNAENTEEDIYKLNDKCDVYAKGNDEQTYTTCTSDGSIQCMASGSSYSMVCYHEAEQKDDTCDGIDDNCNGRIDEDYVFTPCNTGLNGICGYGVKICENGEEKCESLYTAREFDFYGDGTDSNCDEKDWDVDKTVFVQLYNDTGNYSGNDSHSGRADNPVATLAKAFELAKTTRDDSSVIFNDIIVSSKVGTGTNTADRWNKSPITIPTTNQPYRPELKPAYQIPGSELTEADLNALSTKEAKIALVWLAHVQAYQKKQQGAPDYQSYNPNDYLMVEEAWPRHEAVGIYGGFTASGAEWSEPSNTGTRSKFLYKPTATNGVLTSQIYTMVKALADRTSIDEPDESGPLSVIIKNFNFEMTSVTQVCGTRTGTTFIGLHCGRKGCEHLSLPKTSIKVTAPAGCDGKTPSKDNDNWKDERDGVNGSWHNYDDSALRGGPDAYKTNLENNNCMYKYREQKTQTQPSADDPLKAPNDIWHKYTEYYTAISSTEVEYYSDFLCPDQTSPRGGCGGSWCCKGKCGNNVTDQKDGNDGIRGSGTAVGAGAVITSIKTDGGCNSHSVDETQKTGNIGGAGAGGAGGSNSNLSMRLYTGSGGKVRVATYGKVNGVDKIDNIDVANGGYGRSGSGGGGGGVYHCWDKEHYENSWGFAGSGGAGGCGGYGGEAGGTGGSAIGIVVIPPKDTTVSCELNVDTLVDVDGGKGGSGGTGQAGVAGGQGGFAGGYKHSSAGRDLHCFKGTAGGAGGPGGGGGGGAAGLAGHAYGYAFICNRSVESFNDVGHLEDCGFSVPSEMKDTPTSYASAETEKSGASGTAGKPGSWMDDSNKKLTGPNKLAKYESTGGSGGEGATSTVDDGRSVSKPIVFGTTTAF